jgi:hypothetical protein
MKVRPVGADLFHADGQMVGQTKGRRGRHDEPKSSLFTILRTRLQMYYLCILYYFNLHRKKYVRLEVLTAVLVKVRALCNVTNCQFVISYGL